MYFFCSISWFLKLFFKNCLYQNDFFQSLEPAQVFWLQSNIDLRIMDALMVKVFYLHALM